MGTRSLVSYLGHSVRVVPAADLIGEQEKLTPALLDRRFLIGGFWTAYGIIVQPTLALAASFAPASDAGNIISAAADGGATRAYNAGLGMYFAIWGILCIVYFVASLRTYVT